MAEGVDQAAGIGAVRGVGQEDLRRGAERDEAVARIDDAGADAARRDIPGSGLGLYFVKTMVEQQQGRIWVESEVGTGSTFYVLLKKAGAADDS